MDIYQKLKNIVEIEFNNIVADVYIIRTRKLRIILNEMSLIDIYFTYNKKNEIKYSFHWDRTNIDDTIFRHNNTPDTEWSNVNTFPKHFHNGSEYNVISSDIPDQPENALRYFLNFVVDKIKSQSI